MHRLALPARCPHAARTLRPTNPWLALSVHFPESLSRAVYSWLFLSLACAPPRAPFPRRSVSGSAKPASQAAVTIDAAIHALQNKGRASDDAVVTPYSTNLLGALVAGSKVRVLTDCVCT